MTTTHTEHTDHAEAMTELRTKQQQDWSSGDYNRIAALTVAVNETVVASAEVAPGDAVLDVATGTGHAALAAARAGARVTGIDYVPALLDIAEAVGRVVCGDPRPPIELDPQQRAHPVVDREVRPHPAVIGEELEPHRRRRDPGEVVRVREERKDLVERTRNELAGGQSVGRHGNSLIVILTDNKFLPRGTASGTSEPGRRLAGFVVRRSASRRSRSPTR